MLTIRSHQMAVFDKLQLAEFEPAMLAHIRKFFPNDLALLGEDGVGAVIRDAASRALAFGVATRGEVRLFTTLSLVLGADWLADPLHPFVVEILPQGLAPGPAFRRLYDEAIDYVRFVCGAEGQYAIRALLKARRMSFEDMADDTADGGPGALARLTALWPRKMQTLPPVAPYRFLALADERSRAAGFEGPGARHLWTTFMFVLGAGFDRDPALPWVAAALAAPHDRARALYTSGMTAIDDFAALLPSRSAH
jgi:hypothetical protein